MDPFDAAAFKVETLVTAIIRAKTEPLPDRRLHVMNDDHLGPFELWWFVELMVSLN